MKNWSLQDYKQRVRQETIIDAYRDFTGKHSIPADKQYWTLCGECTNEGEPTDRGDLGQMVASGLITPEQFRGVDEVESIIETNRLAYPEVQWFNMRILKALRVAKYNKELNPAIINYDSVVWPKKAIPQFEHIARLAPSDTMLICNMITSDRHNRSANISDIFNSLAYINNSEFDVVTDAYTYTKSTGVAMTTIVVYKK